MWRTYFPRARIYGIDMYDKTSHDERRIQTFQGSQTDAEFLERVVAAIGRLDIVIDDGSHANAHVLRSFELLFPRLAPNGIYAIEDTQTSYWPTYGGSSEDLNRAGTTLELVKRLIDCINHMELRIPDYAPTHLDRNVVALHIYHNLVFVQKGRNDERSNIVWSPAEAKGSRE